ncbi:MAG TPA: glycoside hydrolase family 13 protein, partial [Chloroflexota bacterium]
MQISAVEAPGEIFQTPPWVQDAIFYQIFPDRFASSVTIPKPSNLEPWDSPPTLQGFKGGDLAGVTEHLDYLQDLGVTAIYFCPIFQSTANHRYHTYDYFNVDPILGGNEAFFRLLDEAHRRSMRVVLDGVFNHASRGFFQFNHILENGGNSPYIDWFTVYSWPLYPYGPADKPAGYWAWWNERALPKFNTNTPAVREFLWNVATYWIERGVDGWRLDVPNEIDDDEFWREFRRRVKAVNPDAYIVGEIWGDARRWLAGDQFDAVMNYMFAGACLGFFPATHGIDEKALEGTGLYPVKTLDAVGFKHAIEDLLNLYPRAATLAQLNLLDSHDTARFLTVCRGDESALRLAILFQMTFPGAPCTYYGDEIGMTGGETLEDARRGFEWDASRWNHGLRDHLKSCIALRHAHPVLRRGGYETLYA